MYAEQQILTEQSTHNINVLALNGSTIFNIVRINVIYKNETENRNTSIATWKVEKCVQTKIHIEAQSPF